MQKRSKELLFNFVQQQRTSKPFLKGPPQSKLHCGGQGISFKRKSDDSSSREGFNSYNKAQFKSSGNQNSNLQRNSTTNTTRRVVISTSVGKKVFCSLKVPTVPLVGRLVHFLGSWEKLIKDQNILQIVKGYRIPFLCRPKQKREPKEINF